MLAGAALGGGATLDVPFYDVSLALVRPRVPTLDLSAGCGRSDAVAPPLVPEGDVLLLQPAHTLVERSARAVDFASAAPRAPPVSLTLTPSPSLSLSRTPTLTLALTLTRPRQRRYPRATCSPCSRVPTPCCPPTPRSSSCRRGAGCAPSSTP